MKKTIKKILIILLITVFAVLLFDTVYKLVAYPELFFSTWKYQLMNEVRAGDPEAVEYYQRVYLAHGITLWED